LSSIKCAQCDLVNFASATACKRCGTPLVGGGPLFGVPSGQQGIVLEDGYVLPPPPASEFGTGIWREKSTLVMSKGATLPPYCIRCNEPTHGKVLKRKLSWHHPAIYLIILVALLIYFVVAMVLRKNATVEIGLCEKHLALRRRNIWITWLLCLFGVLGFMMAVVAEESAYMLLSLAFFLGAIIWGVVAVRVVSPAKIDDKFVWLKGVNEDYLNRFPEWPGA
jgi:hypothetical protein